MQYEHNLNCRAQGTKHGEGHHPQVRVLKHKTSQLSARPIIIDHRFFLKNRLLNANLHSCRHRLLIQEQLQHVETHHQDAHHLQKQVGRVEQTGKLQLPPEQTWQPVGWMIGYRQCQEHQHGQRVTQVPLPRGSLPPHFCQEEEQQQFKLLHAVTEGLLQAGSRGLRGQEKFSLWKAAFNLFGKTTKDNEITHILGFLKKKQKNTHNKMARSYFSPRAMRLLWTVWYCFCMASMFSITQQDVGPAADQQQWRREIIK